MADEKKITGKQSKIKVNPRSEEIMERRTNIARQILGNKLTEMRVVDDFDHFAADHFSDEELLEICEEVLSEMDTEDLEEICEAIETNLEVISERMDPKEIQRRRDQAKDRLATGAAMKRAAEKSSSKSSDAKPSRAERVKSALKKAASTTKNVAKKVAKGAGEVAGAARAGYRDAAGSSSSGNTSGSSTSSSGGSSSSSSGGGSSSGDSGEKRVRLRDRLKGAIKKGVGRLARSVSRGARNVARKMGEETVLGFSAFIAEGKVKCKECGGKGCKHCGDKGYMVTHDCSKKVEHAEWGVGECIAEQHTLDTDGNITHYDVKFEHGLEENVSVEDLKTLVSEMHEHAINHDKNQEVLGEKKDEEGFAGEATSYKGVVIKRTKSGYEAPRFNLKSNSVDGIKQNIDKEIAKVDEQVEFAGNYEGPLYAPWTAVEEGKKGLWDNIHAKRKRGEKPAKPGDKDYPETLKVEEVIAERGDFWHPDPDKDKKLGGPGANQRAREDRGGAKSSSSTKSDSKKLRPGESYMDYAKRQKSSSSSSSSYMKSGKTARERLQKAGAKLSPKKEGLRDKIKRKLGLKKEEFAMYEGRAEDAKASLEKVKARQKVLDAHEKKTGKKLDITKTPEHKAHKQNFPGAKRTGKKVKGAKETPSETHNRRVGKNVARIVKHGYTSKEKKEVQSMAKHASRYD